MAIINTWLLCTKNLKLLMIPYTITLIIYFSGTPATKRNWKPMVKKYSGAGEIAGYFIKFLMINKLLCINNTRHFIQQARLRCRRIIPLRFVASTPLLSAAQNAEFMKSIL